MNLVPVFLIVLAVAAFIINRRLVKLQHHKKTRLIFIAQLVCRLIFWLIALAGLLYIPILNIPVVILSFPIEFFHPLKYWFLGPLPDKGYWPLFVVYWVPVLLGVFWLEQRSKKLKLEMKESASNSKEKFF